MGCNYPSMFKCNDGFAKPTWNWGMHEYVFPTSYVDVITYKCAFIVWCTMISILLLFSCKMKRLYLLYPQGLGNCSNSVLQFDDTDDNHLRYIWPWTQWNLGWYHIIWLHKSTFDATNGILLPTMNREFITKLMGLMLSDFPPWSVLYILVTHQRCTPNYDA